MTLPFIGAELNGTKNTHFGYVFGASYSGDSFDASYSGNSEYVPSSLKTVIISNSSGVTSIGERAFYNCSGLTSVTIPNSVTSIGGSAFYNCSGLKGVYITDLEKWCKISFGNNSSNPLSYAHSLYLNNKLVTDLIIPDSITSIGDYVFSGCSIWKSITIPNSVTSIGNSAFSGCSGLTNITIPDSVTSIGDSAFYNCSGLTSITIPDSVTSIGDYAFSGCSGLTNVTIPNSVKYIRMYAFNGCSGLTSVTIGKGVTSIDWYAFNGCTWLDKIYYQGTAEDWNKIYIGGDNDKLTRATRYYYSETKPTESGNYWHYNDNGEIEEW